LLRATLGIMGEALLATDAEGRVTLLNPVAESLTGWTCREAKGLHLETVFRTVNEEIRRTVENAATPAPRPVANGGHANHARLIARDGTERFIDDSAAPIRDEQGNVLGSVRVFRDVSERRRLERLKTEARSYAHSIVETVPEALVVLDADLRVKAANRSFYQTFGVAPEETENQLLFDLGDGQWNIPKLRKLLEEVLPQNTSFQEFEVEHTFPALGNRTVWLSARRLCREGNAAETILFAIEDVTKRKQAARALEASEVRYRRLFETAQDAILILDADTGRIIDANPYLLVMLGYSHEDLLGKELWELGLFRDRAASQAAMRQLQEQRYIRYEDLPLETRHGTRKDVEFVSNVYEVDHQRVIQCNIRDITDRKRAEAALKAADRRKDEFLAMLAHELRNPLAPIRSGIEMMQRKGTDDPDVRWAHDVIERQVQQLTRLVDDLLDLSRISRGKITLRREPVDLAAVVARAVEISRPLIDARKHHLEVVLPDPAVLVDADPTRLAQVVSNLLNNAAKYTGEGGRIELTVERAGDEAVLRVRDTGIGIAADALPTVFELFSQVPSTLSRSEGGLGIGLTLVRSLVEMHGGSIEATSGGLGSGSEFLVRLPRLLALPVSLGAAAGARERVAQASPRLILIVDDNGDAAEMLAIVLRLEGHEVRTAYDGPTALDAVRAQAPDVVLCDIGMPGMDGLDVARCLRQDFGLKQALLVAVTGYGQEADHRRSREAGFDAHLIKPVDLHVLQYLLARAGALAPH